jgi:hypothetical protein
LLCAVWAGESEALVGEVGDEAGFAESVKTRQHLKTLSLIKTVHGVRGMCVWGEGTYLWLPVLLSADGAAQGVASTLLHAQRRHWLHTQK